MYQYNLRFVIELVDEKKEVVTYLVCEGVGSSEALPDLGQNIPFVDRETKPDLRMVFNVTDVGMVFTEPNKAQSKVTGRSIVKVAYGQIDQVAKELRWRFEKFGFTVHQCDEIEADGTPL